jgi:hypothetical protein
MRTASSLVAMLSLVLVSIADAQTPTPSPGAPAPSAPGTAPGPGPGTAPGQVETPGREPTREPTLPTPAGTGPTVPLSVPTLIGQNLLSPPAPQGPITLTPTITISEEFNDNVFQDNSNRRSDFITGFTPGVTLTIQRPEYRLNAGYNFTAEIYAKETQLSNAANRHNLVVDGFYLLTPTVTFTLNELLVYDRNQNVSSPQGFSAGRAPSLSNTLSPGLTIQATPLTAVRVFGAYQLQRYFDDEIAGGNNDSDIVLAGAAVDRAFTPRLTGTASFSAAWLSVSGEDDAYALTPELGVTYRFTPTLSASVMGGPSVVFQSGETSVAPAGSVSIAQRFKYGSASLSYERAVGTGGSFGGVTDNQSIAANLTLDSLLKGFVVTFGPRYTMSDNVQRGNRPNEEVRALNIGLDATYQIARSVALVAAYNYFHEKADLEQGPTRKIDQNRVFVGIQFGYPFSFD